MTHGEVEIVNQPILLALVGLIRPTVNIILKVENYS